VEKSWQLASNTAVTLGLLRIFCSQLLMLITISTRPSSICSETSTLPATTFRYWLAANLLGFKQIYISCVLTPIKSRRAPQTIAVIFVSCWVRTSITGEYCWRELIIISSFLWKPVRLPSHSALTLIVALNKSRILQVGWPVGELMLILPLSLGLNLLLCI
jgi:hypothetical protein